MSTRGLIGFYHKETDKLTYNHSDSYPEFLGKNILSELKEVSDWGLIKDRVENLVAIPDSRVITDNDALVRSEIRRHFDGNYQVNNPKDYYSLFKPFQGRLKPYLDGKLTFMATANDFVYDSLFCEWAYIVNLDTQKFEVWRGIQSKPDLESRYDMESDRMGYYPCKLLKDYSLLELPGYNKFYNDCKKMQK